MHESIMKILSPGVLVAGLLVLACGNSATYLGVYRSGDEVRSFKPCGSDSLYQVVASDSIQALIDSLYVRATDRYYQPMWLEVVGRFGAVDDINEAVNYDGALEIAAVEGWSDSVFSGCGGPEPALDRESP